MGQDILAPDVVPSFDTTRGSQMADDTRDDAKAGFSDPASSIQLKIRIKPALRAQLQAATAEHGVSLNQEIV